MINLILICSITGNIVKHAWARMARTFYASNIEFALHDQQVDVFVKNHTLLWELKPESEYFSRLEGG